MALKVPTRAELEERRQLLQGRLNDGYQRIEEAEQAGADVAEWEAFWIKLLHEYEQVCRDLDNLRDLPLQTMPADTPCVRHDPIQAAQLALGGS